MKKGEGRMKKQLHSTACVLLHLFCIHPSYFPYDRPPLCVSPVGKHPFANTIIVVTIGLLVGALSTIYAGLKSLEHAELPYPKPEQLVKLWRVSSKQLEGQFPADVFHELRRTSTAFSGLGAIGHAGQFTLSGSEESETVTMMNVTAEVPRLSGLPRIWDAISRTKKSGSRPTWFS